VVDKDGTLCHPSFLFFRWFMSSERCKEIKNTFREDVVIWD